MLIHIGAGLAALVLGGVAPVQGARPVAWDFQADAVNGPPAGFSFARTGGGRPGRGVVLLEVGCKPVSGKTDRACGLVFRYRDENHYYVARANALEDNVRLYRVVKGRRSQIGGWNGKVASGAWHALAVEARGDRIEVFWEGRAVIGVADGTFPEAGKFGLWTKADSVTYFDGLSATPLP